MSQTSNLPLNHQNDTIFIAYQLPENYSSSQTFPALPNRCDVFLAFAHEEDSSVRVLEYLLEAEGLRPWVGDLDLLLSPVSAKTLNQGIEDCDAFILMLGSATEVPFDLQDELAQALDLNKLTFLVAHQRLDSPPLEQLGLHRLCWVPVTLGDRRPPMTIAKCISYVLTYARLQKRTFEWKRNAKSDVWLLSKGDLKKTKSQANWLKSHSEIGLSITQEQSDFLTHSQIKIRSEGKSHYFHGKSPDIFISYSRKNRDFVQHLARDLASTDFVLWLDWENIPVAAHWRHEVEEGIRESHTFIFVISADSVTSEHCLWELQKARYGGCRIIPIVCSHDYNREQLTRIGLSALNYVSFERETYPQAFNKLVQTIRTDFQDVKDYNRFYSKAYEWHLQNRPRRLLLNRKDYRAIQGWLKRRSRKEIAQKGASQLLQLHPVQIEYLNNSKIALAREHQRNALVGVGVLGCCLLFLSAAIIARLAEIRALVASLEDQGGLDSLITALRAGQKLENRPYLEFFQPDLRLRATTALHQETVSVRELNRLDGHERAVYDIEFSPAGRQLVSVGEDQTVRAWNFAAPITNPMKRHSDWVVDVAHSSDGDFFATGSYDGEVNIWSCQTLSFTGQHTRKAGRENFSENWKAFLLGLDSFLFAKRDNEDSPDSSCQWLDTLPEAHQDGIVRVRVSPGSQYVASASFDGKVNLWRRGSEYTAAGRFDGNLHLLQARGLDSFTLLHEFSHDGNPVFALDFDPQRRRLVTADASGVVKIWSLESGALIDSLDTEDFVIDVMYSQDGKYVAISGNNGLLRVWDLAGDRVTQLPGHVGFTRVAFHPHDNRLASADDDGNIKLWRIKDLQTAFEFHDLEIPPDALKPFTLKGHQDAVLRIQFSPDGSYLASASADDTIRLWLTADGALLDVIEGHQDEVLGLAFSSLLKDDPYSETEVGVTYLASSSRDGTVRIWRINNDVRPLPHEGRIYDVAFRPDGKVLASAGVKTISLWRLRDYARISHIQAASQGDVFSVHYDPLGRLLVAGDSNGNIKVWQPDTSEGTRRPIAEWDHKSPDEAVVAETALPEVLVVRFSPNGEFIASGASDGTVRFWDAKGRSLGHHKVGHSVTNLSFSPDSQNLVIVSKVPIAQAEEEADGNVDIYQVVQSFPQPYEMASEPPQITLNRLSQVVASEETHVGGILTVTFNPSDPDEFATGGEDSTVKLWSTTGNLIRTLEGHEGGITRVDYSHDGNLLASSSRDNTVKLWHVSSGQLVSSLNSHQRQVTKVSFNPENSTVLASSGFDNQVLIWKIPDGFNFNPLRKLSEIGCKSVKNYLSLDDAVGRSDLYTFMWHSQQDLSQDEKEYAKNLQEVRKYCLAIQDR